MKTLPGLLIALGCLGMHGCGGSPPPSDLAGGWHCPGDDFLFEFTLQGHVGGPITGSGKNITPSNATIAITGTESHLIFTFSGNGGSDDFQDVHIDPDSQVLRLDDNSGPSSPGFACDRGLTGL
jgi:hypothetical protein